jgi:hypothetical protein
VSTHRPAEVPRDTHTVRTSATSAPEASATRIVVVRSSFASFLPSTSRSATYASLWNPASVRSSLPRPLFVY